MAVRSAIDVDDIAAVRQGVGRQDDEVFAHCQHGAFSSYAHQNGIIFPKASGGSRGRPAMEPPERSIWLCGTHHPLRESLAVDGAICTLVDAITTANNDQPTGGCTSGADTLVLPARSTLTEVNNYICCSNAVRQYRSAMRFARPAAPYWPVRTTLRLAPH